VAAPFNDNLLFSGSPQLDFAGFAFDISGDVINIFFAPLPIGYVAQDPTSSLGEGASFSATQIIPTSVPEPGSLALLARCATSG
jgi:hypothetical protein